MVTSPSPGVKGPTHTCGLPNFISTPAAHTSQPTLAAHTLGSSARFIWCMTAMAGALLEKCSAPTFIWPMPCSALTLPLRCVVHSYTKGSSSCSTTGLYLRQKYEV